MADYAADRACPSPSEVAWLAQHAKGRKARAEMLKTAITCFKVSRNLLDETEARDMMAKANTAAVIGLLMGNLPYEDWVELDD